MPEKFGLLLFCALVGFFAGGVRAARRNVETAVKNPFADCLTQSAASGIAAFLAAAFCLDRLAGHVYLVLGIAGVAGWGGALVLDLAADGAANWLKRRIGRSAGPTAKPPAPPGENPPTDRETKP
jgi:hypothetical protein